MGRLGYLVCHTCKHETCLGRWIVGGDDVGYGFWRGDDYNGIGLKALNFLARHFGHDVRFLMDHDFEKLNVDDYRDVDDELRSDWPADAKRG